MSVTPSMEMSSLINGRLLYHKLHNYYMITNVHWCDNGTIYNHEVNGSQMTQNHYADKAIFNRQRCKYKDNKGGTRQANEHLTEIKYTTTIYTKWHQVPLS